ncbi:MAG: LysR family transcriptional regulator [Gammaproteobacteria bacterium]|jgi:DNA-binding transcriptional LysR family regulator
MAKKTSTVFYKQNRLKQLRAFCMAAKTGSISQAAEALYQSQPTVTLQIQALERELKITVFERRGPHISLTPEGAVLLQVAQPLVDGIDGLEENFHAHFGNLDRGELNIAAGESTLLYIMPTFIKRFSEVYPGIQIKLHNVTGRDGMAMLRSDEADLAIGSMLDIPDDIIYRPSIFYSSTLITPKKHPLAKKKNITLDDISKFGLILPPRHLATWRMLEMVFDQHGSKFQVSLEAGGWEIIKKYVSLDMGISIVTGVCLSNDDNLFQYPLDEFIPKRSYGVVVRRGKFLSPQTQAFIDMIDPAFFSDRH